MPSNKLWIPAIILLIFGAYLFGRNTIIKDSKINSTQEKKINYLQDIDTKYIDTKSSDFFSKDENGKEVELPKNQKDSLIKFLMDKVKQDNIKFDDNCDVADSKAQIAEVDLSGMSEKSYIVMPSWLCGLTMRGASGNGEIYILKQSGDNWEEISNLRGNSFAITKHKTNGYFDILTNWHMSAVSGTQFLFKWQIINSETKVGRYEEFFSKNYD